MSYTPFVFFGYTIEIPDDMEVRTLIPMLYDLNGMIPSPFQIKSLITSYDHIFNEEDHVRIVIGFHPDHIGDLIEYSRDLSGFIMDTPLLDGFTLSDAPVFHCGVEWRPESDSDSDSGSGSESGYDSVNGSDIYDSDI